MRDRIASSIVFRAMWGNIPYLAFYSLVGAGVYVVIYLAGLLSSVPIPVTLRSVAIIPTVGLLAYVPVCMIDLFFLWLADGKSVRDDAP